MTTSPPEQLDDDLRVALECSDKAAELALQFFEAGVDAQLKADGSPVTEADPAVEQLLHDLLGTTAPGDAFLGEELGAVGSSERVWILDPIDGTSFFARGNPHWRVQVALEVAGHIQVAVVTAPALGLQWWASRSGGAFEASWPRTGDATRLSVSTTAALDAATLDALTRNRSRLPQEFTIVPARSDGWCAGLIALVRGEVDCFLAECCQVWDHAPWVLIVEESGGRFTNRDGGSAAATGGGLYSNKHVHAELLAHLSYPVTQGPR